MLDKVELKVCQIKVLVYFKFISCNRCMALLNLFWFQPNLLDCFNKPICGIELVYHYKTGGYI